MKMSLLKGKKKKYNIVYWSFGQAKLKQQDRPLLISGLWNFTPSLSNRVLTVIDFRPLSLPFP